MTLLPFKVDFDITLECMYKCRHCNVDAGAKLEDEMDTEQIKNVLIQLYEAGVSEVAITGGEPLLRSDFFEILEFAYEMKGLSLTLNTNGLLLNKEMIDKFADKYPNLNIAVSLDGYDIESYGILRKSFEKPDKILEKEFKVIVENLKYLAKTNLSVGTNFTVTKATINNLSNTYSFVKSLGIEKMLFIKFFPFGQGATHEDELELDYDQWKDLLCSLTDKKDNDKYYSGLQVSVTCPWELHAPLLDNYSIEDIHRVWNYYSPLESELYSRERNVGCHAGITSCAISPNGDVYPCGTISSKYPDFVCGNLKSETYQSILNSSGLINKLRSLNINDYEGHCKKCEIVNLCGGGCRARAYTKSRNLLSEDYLCPYHCDSDFKLRGV